MKMLKIIGLVLIVAMGNNVHAMLPAPDYAAMLAGYDYQLEHEVIWGARTIADYLDIMEAYDAKVGHLLPAIKSHSEIYNELVTRIEEERTKRRMTPALLRSTIRQIITYMYRTYMTPNV